MIRYLVSTLVLAAVLAGPATAQTSARKVSAPAATRAPSWQIDPLHSELSFRVRHLVSRVSGTFGEWSGSIVADPAQLNQGVVEVSIKTASIDTGNDKRDEHLRSGDFFEAAQHPEITFRSQRVEVKGESLKVYGALTMRGVTKPVVLEGRYLGRTKDAQGKERIGFEAETTVNRQHFGVSWNHLVEGAAMVGDEVTISLVVAAVRQ